LARKKLNRLAENAARESKERSLLPFNAVIVFVVLSEYFITYLTLAKRQDASGYTVARLSRLWPTAIEWVIDRLLAGKYPKAADAAEGR
jgi:peptidoglycan/LPS O-acetylase OafA/YrhL